MHYSYLLLDTELIGVATLLLAAVSGTRRKTGIALAADHLLAVVLGGKSLQGGLNDTTTETEDKVKGGLLLDVVVRKSSAVFKLLAGEDKTLLVRGNSCGKRSI
jgi:predicted ABC-type sugar transport system permease subunit